MATTMEQKGNEEEMLRTVGKLIDERFSRKSPAKPYDRPPTALRTSRNDSWIFKLVDPAQRLISSGSQMLFSSVFRNFSSYLTSHRTSSQVASESSQSRKDDKKRDGTDPSEAQAATKVGDNRNRSDRFGMMELAKTLKQKTFTRSEIDRFTTLLPSRNVDLPVVNEEKKFEFISSIPESNRKKEFVKVPNSEVKMGRKSISTPILSSSVLDEDISSPAEIARAYMGSRQPVCPSMRSLRTQGLGGNSAGPTSISFSSKSTDMLLVPSSTSQGLKRRSPIFDSHIGSTVPQCRIRKKPNIHLSKGLSLPISGRPISVPVHGLSFDACQSSKFEKVLHIPSSIRNSKLSLKPKKIFARKFIMNVESDKIPGAGSSSIYTPSSSYKMASKILEQLDKLTPSKEKVSTLNRLPVGEKSPLKPSPSTVGGSPLRSLEDEDLPRSKEFVNDDKQSSGLHGVPCLDKLDHTFQNKEKMENMKPRDPHHRCALLDSGSIESCKDSMNDLVVPASAVLKSTIQPPEDKRTLQIWPDKDSVDHDESSADRVAPATAGVRVGDIFLAVRQTTANKTLAPAKPQTTSEVVVGSPLNRSPRLKVSDDCIDDDMDTRFSFQNASSLCTTAQPESTIDSAPTDCFENKDLPENKQSDSPVFSFGNNVSLQEQPYASSIAFDVGNKENSFTESCAAFKNGNGASYPYTQCNSASSYSDVQRSVYLNVDTSSNHKLDRPWGICNSAFSSSASISAGLAFPFRSSVCNQSLNNGASISCPSLFSSNSFPIVSLSQSSSRNIFLSAINASNGANIITTDSHPSTTNLAPSSTPLTTRLGTYEDKTEQDTSLHNVNDTYFNSITAAESSHYCTFSFGAATTPSSMNNQLSTPAVSKETEPSALEVSAGKEFTANMKGMSTILGSSKSLESSGLAGKVSVSSSIFFGCSSSASKLFNSGSRPSDFPITGFTSAPATSTISASNVSSSSARLGLESFMGASFSPICSTTSATTALAGSSSKPVSCNSHPKVAFRVSSGNNDCKELGISKDKVPLFSQKAIQSGFSFGPATSELNPFQVGKQQTLMDEPPNSYPYIDSPSILEAKAGGSFPLSTGGGDKANRRFVKIRRRK